MKDEARVIAGKLTKAQREALTMHRNTQEWRGRNAPQYWLPLWSPDGLALKMAGLITFVDAVSSDTRLTPLGLAVRTILQEQGR
ncbi:hypothetical protein [Alteraurantiacibacter buctensis]|uniref:Uncharacterized protein n=1 Tax=Alteraurantiacibacter buctensis TaxID=1503981 RepID=A0A844Z0M7_9SPHN|nr:hypothetical protein [Alteraurantiacibacter buctensis]MXO72898.1 hypothetical protein [Alteraurantiacibacter buctensis]